MKTRKRAIEACQILNGFVGDLVAATRMFEIIVHFQWTAQPTSNAGLLIMKMADSYLILALAKWLEFYDHYKGLIPDTHLTYCKRLRAELNRRGIMDFRNKVVGHIWSKDGDRPLSAEEIGLLDKKITDGDHSKFLKWVNDPINNVLGNTVVGTCESVLNKIKNDWAISNEEIVDRGAA